MNSIVLLSASITLFLISILFLDQSNIDNYNHVDAISIGEHDIIYISTLPPVGEPVPVPNNPFSTAEGTPEIVLKYNNSVYKGELRSAVFASGDVNDNIPSFEEDSPSITTIIPNQIINITQGEQIQLYIYENPKPEPQPNSFSSTLYHLNGTVSKILSLKDGDKMDTFTIDTDKGEYLLLAIATWLPNPDHYLTTSGYVSYVFKINVI
ncbi:hypothetical protein YTPLAS21_18990 [Candidatus Nitrosocosmicus sp.]|nr:hypothetical protein YTPLAS21_18990 [Candidatus Nitrosocosmicus sp.]